MWRLRDLVRVEDPPGTLSLVAGRTSYWRAWPEDDGVVELPRHGDNRWSYDASRFVMVKPHDYWSEWLELDPELVRTTLRADVHDGRPAWSFTAPKVRGGTAHLVVDAELGLVVRVSREDVGVVEEWTDLGVDPSLDESFFTG